MTGSEVQALVEAQSREHLAAMSHGITLADALVPPRTMEVVWKRVERGKWKNVTLEVWLVGQEAFPDGYKLILRADGGSFGLAADGFLVGWYGSLVTAFLSM